MRYSRGIVLGLILLAVAIAPYAYFQALLLLHDFRPLVRPLPLTKGTMAFQQIKPTLTAPHGLVLEFPYKESEYKRTLCLIGTELFDRCEARSDLIDITWSVSNRHGTVAQGSSKEFRTGSYVDEGLARLIGEFQAQGGENYNVTLEINADATSIGSTPNFVIAASSTGEFHNWFVAAQLSEYFGAIVGGLGFLVVLTSAWSRVGSKLGFH